VVSVAFLPPENIEEIFADFHVIEAEPFQWDPEGEAVTSANQSYQVSSERNQWASSEEPRWYALHTRARHEKTVEKRLRDHGMETFVPSAVEVHRWSDRKKKVEVPLFSCYVFVRCALSTQDRTHVYQIESVHGFVGSRGASLPIPDEQIESIRKVLTQTAPWRAYPFLKVGQRVRVRGGAMDGVEGVFLSENGDHSLIISVDAIQRSMAVRIDGYHVEPV
jgi:transcription antitermination factor NusG